jgi:hypothetical protein
LIERTELVSGETSVTVCIAVRGIQRGKMIQEQREIKRTIEREDKRVNARRILGKTKGSDK